MTYRVTSTGVRLGHAAVRCSGPRTTTKPPAVPVLERTWLKLPRTCTSAVPKAPARSYKYRRRMACSCRFYDAGQMPAVQAIPLSQGGVTEVYVPLHHRGGGGGKVVG